MIKDREERYANAMKREIELINRKSAFSRARHDESARMTEDLIADLARELQHSVRKALEDEARTTAVAESWLEDAKAIGAWLTRTRNSIAARQPNLVEKVDTSNFATGTPEHHELGTQSDSVLDDLETSRAQNRRIQELRILASLEQDLRKTSHDAPSPDEVEEHATELARLLISNWLGILEDSLEEHRGKPLKLAFGVIPEDAKINDLMEGCAAFALPVQNSVLALFKFQNRLVQAGTSTRLSPWVAIGENHNGERYIFPTDYAWRPSAPNTHAQRTWMDHIHGVANIFGTLILSRANQLQSDRPLRVHSIFRCSAAATSILSKARAKGQFAIAELDLRGSSALTHVRVNENVVNLLVRDLKSSLHARPAATLAAKPQTHLFNARAIHDDGNVYLAALPTAASLMAMGAPEADYPAPIEDVSLQTYTAEERQLVYATCEVVAAVLDATESSSKVIGQSVRARQRGSALSFI